MTIDDQLYIRSRNSLAAVVLRIAGRVLTPDGEIVPFNFEHTPATDRSALLSAFRLAEGFLLSAVVFPSTGAPTRGQTFVELGFLRGIGGAGDVVDVLAKDYVAEAEPLAFPGSPIRSSLEGPGAIRSITGTDPAAAANISETVPTDARWRLHSLLATFVADANVANRRVIFLVGDGSNVYQRSGAVAAQTANISARYNFGPFGMSVQSTAGDQIVASSQGLVLAAGHTLQTTVVNIQAGDNWGAPQLLVEEWLED